MQKKQEEIKWFLSTRRVKERRLEDKSLRKVNKFLNI